MLACSAQVQLVSLKMYTQVYKSTSTPHIRSVVTLEILPNIHNYEKKVLTFTK